MFWLHEQTKHRLTIVHTSSRMQMEGQLMDGERKTHNNKFYLTKNHLKISNIE